MSQRYEQALAILRQQPKTWLVTGCAGFIGSNLIEVLLSNNQRVRGLDNFATGHQRNLDEVQARVGDDLWQNFSFINADIRDLAACQSASEGVDYVLHQAALGSVPRSLNDPITSNQVNIDGMLNMLVAARDAKVQAFVYAASSSTYGDHPALPKVEDTIGKPLSPYAITKYVNELYADVFSRSYGFHSIGLRYFNVFGQRQDPNGAYAAVIPKWIAAMLAGQPITINGDGETSRDFCYIDNVIQANILAATAVGLEHSQVYNVAVNHRTSLNQLFTYLQTELEKHGKPYAIAPIHADFRAGDVRHSQADVSKAQRELGFEPTHSLRQGLEHAMAWYVQFLS